jgi:epoxyqueuosine reductase
MHTTVEEIANGVKEQARALGFSMAGIVSADPSPHLAAYHAWIAAGLHGEMGYMARPDRVARRNDPGVILPGVRTIICVGLDYATAQVAESVLNDPARGRISNYAWGADYHDVMVPRLEALAAWLAQAAGEPVRSRAYVDTGAILERSHAQQAGLGFTGKSTMLIAPQRGTFFFLGELLTTLALPPDRPNGSATPSCGRCTRCLTACPTGAFPRPFVLDARRCISYLTIELKGAIPPALRPLLGNHVYGCDICQTVCPFNRFAPETVEPLFRPIDPDQAAPPLDRLLTLTEPRFRELYGGGPIGRIGRDRLVRNACVAAGNSGCRDLLPLLERLCREDNSPLVREHAAWGLKLGRR